MRSPALAHLQPIAQDIWEMKYRLKDASGAPIDATVEQTHDPHRHGVAVVIDVTRLQGGAGGGRGTFLMIRE